MTENPEYGTLLVQGTANERDARITVNVADGEGGVVFGADTTLSVRRPRWVEPDSRFQASVQVSGMSEHSTDLACARAAALLQVAVLGDLLVSLTNVSGLTPVQALLVAGTEQGFTAVADYPRNEQGEVSPWADVARQEFIK